MGLMKEVGPGVGRTAIGTYRFPGQSQSRHSWTRPVVWSSPAREQQCAKTRWQRRKECRGRLERILVLTESDRDPGRVGTKGI
jgi:hypothetical protein